MARGWWDKVTAYGAKRFRSAPAATAVADQTSDATAERDTFCILAWNHLQIAPNGTAKMCCIASEDITQEKRVMSLYSDSYDDIWNSEYMRSARRGMSEGEKISPCRRCFHEEDAVGKSRRTMQNALWLAEYGKTPREIIEETRKNDWRVEHRPSYLQLNMGNLCNLACRMCSSQYSSKIENDPVHSKWAPPSYPDVARWRGSKLHIGPRPFFGVTYTGFHDYQARGHISQRWCSSVGTINFKIPENISIVALGLSLRTRGLSLPAVIKVNGIEVFSGKIGPQWTQRFELPGLGNQSELEIEIAAGVAGIGGPMLGVALLDAWIERDSTGSKPLSNERTLTRHSAAEGWWAQPEVMFDEILGEAERLRCITFQGGEPFLVKEFDGILDVLIAKGSASRVTFEVVSNFTMIKDSTIAKLARLAHVYLGASIDGIGPILEYIRYPAVWSDIEHNLDRVAALPNAEISFNTAIQAYNLGDVVNILNYCDRRGITANMHFLVAPKHLNVCVLPRDVRKAAIDQVTAYLATKDPRPANRFAAEYIVRFLREHLPVHYRDQFNKFVKFTNDLDVSRGQSFQALYPELVRAFARDGLKWTNETAFASKASVA